MLLNLHDFYEIFTIKNINIIMSEESKGESLEISS